jgi:RNA polymerase sigma factor (sigma-70 family)
MRETWFRTHISGPSGAYGASVVTPCSPRGCTASPPTAPPRRLDDGAPFADPRLDHDPQLRAEADDLRTRLHAALDALPPRLRAVVVLRDVYELSHESIAAELGISETAAKVRLHRARHKLRDHLFPRRDGEASRAV